MRNRINLDKAKPRMAGYWKFNMSFLNVKDFRDQLLLIIQQELACSVFGDKLWVHLKDSIRSFTADYSG